VIHETSQDKQREREIANEVAEHWGVHPMELHRNHVLDCVFLDRPFNGKVSYGRPPLILGASEIKHRPKLIYGIGFGEGYRIALNKVFRAQQWHETTRKPCWLIVRFNDGFIRYARLRFPLPEPAACWAGRTDRPDDPMAMEPHGIVPWAWWSKLYDDTDNL
jgi:hypothetical protein